jgi:hypothetical protein
VYFGLVGIVLEHMGFFLKIVAIDSIHWRLTTGSGYLFGHWAQRAGACNIA